MTRPSRSFSKDINIMKEGGIKDEIDGKDDVR
jgi:hypothetical protein